MASTFWPYQLANIFTHSPQPNKNIVLLQRVNRANLVYEKIIHLKILVFPYWRVYISVPQCKSIQILKFEQNYNSKVVRAELCQYYLLSLTPESVQVGYNSSSLQEIIQVTLFFFMIWEMHSRFMGTGMGIAISQGSMHICICARKLLFFGGKGKPR